MVKLAPIIPAPIKPAPVKRRGAAQNALANIKRTFDKVDDFKQSNDNYLNNDYPVLKKRYIFAPAGNKTAKNNELTAGSDVPDATTQSVVSVNHSMNPFQEAHVVFCSLVFRSKRCKEIPH